MPHWWFAIYWWLEENNLYKSQVAFWVTLALSASIGAILRPWRAWRQHRETQDKIADRLDTGTPGGLSDLVAALNRVVADLTDGDAPDDNGSDPVITHEDHADDDDNHKRNEDQLHGGIHGVNGHGSSVIPDPLHGGGNSAGHR